MMVESSDSPMESSSKIVLLGVISTTEDASGSMTMLGEKSHSASFYQVAFSMRLLSTSILLRIYFFVVLLPVGQVPQYWTTAWISRPFLPRACTFAFSLVVLIFCFHTERTEILNILLCASDNDVHWNSLTKSFIFSGISLAHLSTALAAYLPLAPPMVSSKFSSMWVQGFKGEKLSTKRRKKPVAIFNYF